MIAAGKAASQKGFNTNAAGICISLSAVIGGSGISPLNLWTGNYSDPFTFITSGKLWAVKFGVTIGVSAGMVFGAFNKDPNWLMIQDGGTKVTVDTISLAVIGGIQLFVINRLEDGSNLGFMVGPVAGVQFELAGIGFAAKIET